MTHTITILFPNEADANYNIGYYISHHMPLCEQQWKKYGLQSWTVTRFAPALDGSQPPYTFSCNISWDNEAGIKEAFESEEAAAVMEDVPRFSNKQPMFLFGATLV